MIPQMNNGDMSPQWLCVDGSNAITSDTPHPLSNRQRRKTPRAATTTSRAPSAAAAAVAGVIGKKKAAAAQPTNNNGENSNNNILAPPQWLCADGTISDTPPPLSRQRRKTPAARTTTTATRKTPPAVVVGRKNKKAGEEPTKKKSGKQQQQQEHQQNNTQKNKQVSFHGNVRVRYISALQDLSPRRIAATYYSRQDYTDIRERRHQEATLLSDMQRLLSAGATTPVHLTENDACLRGIEYEVSTEVRHQKIQTRYAATKAVLDEQEYQKSTGLNTNLDTKFLAEAYSKCTTNAAEAAVRVAQQDALLVQLYNNSKTMDEESSSSTR